MFGIGFWEMLVIAGLVLVAVGPERLPGMLKQLAKFYRQFRRTAEDIRSSTGIDQLLRDEELKELAELRKQRLDLLGTGAKPAPKPVVAPVKSAPTPAITAPVKPLAKAVPDTVAGPTAEAIPMGIPAAKSALGAPAKNEVVRGVSSEDREREHPAIGVDLSEARFHEPPATRVSVADVPPEHIHPSKAAMFAKASGGES
jgi:sec-independent protein translocase protein TatB